MFGEMLRPGTDHVDRVLKRYGVHVEGGFTWDSLYTVPDTFLQLSAEEFEYPMPEKPTNFRFIGPVAPDRQSNPEVPAWFRKIDPSKAVIFVSQGGVANADFSELIEPTLQALDGEDVEVIVTGGGRDVANLPAGANVHAERYLSYDLVLPRTAIFITNGGFTGVVQALGYGVPVIAAGSTEEKPIVAAHVAWSGAGLDLKTGRPSPEEIRKAVHTILGDSAFKRRAEELKVSFGRYSAFETTAEIVESTLRTRARSA